MERRRQVLLKYIPEEEEGLAIGLPDTPMFRHSGRVTMKSQEHIEKELQGHPQLNQQRSSTGSLQLPESVDSEQSSPQESQVKGIGCQLNSSSKATNFTESDGISRSKSTMEIGLEQSELERLRKSNSYNERIIRQLTTVNKQLQSKLDCFELSNNELRLQLLQRSGECSALKEFIQNLRYEHTEEHVMLKNQIMMLQDRLTRQELYPSSLDRPPTIDSQPHPQTPPQHHTRKKLREILLKNSLTESSIDSNQKPHSSSSFKLKSFRNSLSNLRNDDCSVDRSREKQNTFDEPPPQQLREQLQKLEYRMEHLADQQKLLSFKNSLLEMKIK